MRWRRLWLFLHPRQRRMHREAVAECRRWQHEEREKMALYNWRVRQIVTDDGGRSWR